MKIKELLSDESKWTQGASAKDKFGNPTSVFDATTVCWCIGGAFTRCYSNASTEEQTSIITKLQDIMGVYCIPKWNDSPERTFVEVKALVEKLDI